jgi:hypothetical protein
MQSRDWIALFTLGLFAIPAALLVYAAWFGGRGVEDGIYSAIQALRGVDEASFSDVLVRVGRFLTAWWWFIAMACIAASTLVATLLAATQPEASVWQKAIWVISFLVVGITVPVYCVWQVGSRPN